MSHGGYPYRLVPYAGLQRKIDFSVVIDDGNDFAVARRFDGRKEDALKQLSTDYYVFRNPEDCLEDLYKEIPQLSMTIMGAMSTCDDMKFIQHGNAKIEWDGCTHNVSEYINQVSTTEDYFCVYYRASLLHRQPVKYEKRFGNLEDFKNNINHLSPEERNESVLLKNFSSANRYPMKDGRLELDHKPTMLNYS